MSATEKIERLDRTRDGIILGLQLHLLQIPLTLGLAFIIDAGNRGWGGIGALFLQAYLISATQLVYLLPAMWIRASKGRIASVKGLCIVGVATCVLHAGIRAINVTRPLPF